MPHDRVRYASSILPKLLAHSAIVGILGQRQVGKTTLASKVSSEYETLDLQKNLENAERKPSEFLENRACPFTIDECQLAPHLFPALKEKVRINPRKGQFILTGSVRFTSRRAIRESLTGRIVNLELLPFSIAESFSEPLPEQLNQWISAPAFPQLQEFSVRRLEKIQIHFKNFLITGGLPGICFFRDSHVRALRFETHLETLLERDLRLLVNTSMSYRQLRNLSSLLARRQGEPLHYSDLARKIGVSAPTVTKIIHAMESMFLIRTIGSQGSGSPSLFFEDQGVASYLMGEDSDPQKDLARGLFANLLPQFYYRPEVGPISWIQYRTRGGAFVDFAVKTRFGIMGILPVADVKPPPSALASARSFLSHIRGSKVVIAHMGTEVTRISDSLISIPYPMLLTDLG